MTQNRYLEAALCILMPLQAFGTAVEVYFGLDAVQFQIRANFVNPVSRSPLTFFGN